MIYLYLTKNNIKSDIQVREKKNEQEHQELTKRWAHSPITYLCNKNGLDDLICEIEKGYSPDLIFIDPYNIDNTALVSLKVLIPLMEKHELKFII